MFVTFSSETFSWLKENSKEKSVAAFIVEIVEEKISSPHKGVNNERKENTRSTE